MSEAITIESELSSLEGRNPFSAFTIVMSNGDRFEVEASERLLVFRTTVVLFPLDPDGHVTLQIRQVSSIEVFE